MGRIKNIEFLRIVGCIAIVMLHLFMSKLGQIDSVPFYHYLIKATKNGQKAVDLFFMLSGLFYAITYSPVLTTGKLILKKIIRLYPVFFVSLALCYGLALLSPEYTFSLWNALLSMLGFNATTYVIGSTNHVSEFWYATILIWVLLLFHCSLKVFDKEKVKWAAGIIAFFTYGFIISSHGGKIGATTTLYGGIVTMAMLRGIAGISVGYLIGNWYKENFEKIKEWRVSLEGKILMSVITVLCLYFIVMYMTFVRWTFKNDTLFIVAFIILIVLFLLNKDYVSRILSIDIWGKFSKYVYSTYMTHCFVIKYLAIIFWSHSMKFVVKHPIVNFSLTLSLVLIVGVMVYHLVEKPCAAYLKKRWLSE